jgi:hypothetical protein
MADAREKVLRNESTIPSISVFVLARSQLG